MGQTRSVEGPLGATWPNPQLFLPCVYVFEEYPRSIVLEREKSRMEEPIVGTSRGWTETMTEVATLASLDCAFGLTYLVARRPMFLELRIDSARHGKSSFGSSGRKAMGRQWIASWASLGVRRKGNLRDSPTWKDLLSLEDRASK